MFYERNGNVKLKLIMSTDADGRRIKDVCRPVRFPGRHKNSGRALDAGD